MSRSPENVRIENRQQRNRIIWSTEPWKFKRALFFSHPENFLCAWCSNLANVVAHPPNSETYGTPDYLDFNLAGCYPLCGPCARAEHRGKVLCPRCRQQGHYVREGETCWSCKSKEEQELLLKRKEGRRREVNERNRETYKRYHRKKVIRNGVWVFADTGEKTTTSPIRKALPPDFLEDADTAMLLEKSGITIDER